MPEQGLRQPQLCGRQLVHDVPGPDEQVAPLPSSPFAAGAALAIVRRLGVVEGGEGVGGREVAHEGGVVARGHRAEQLGPQVVLEGKEVQQPCALQCSRYSTLQYK